MIGDIDLPETHLDRPEVAALALLEITADFARAAVIAHCPEMAAGQTDHPEDKASPKALAGVTVLTAIDLLASAICSYSKLASLEAEAVRQAVDRREF